MKRALLLSVVSLLAFSVVLAAADRYEYKLLATNRTGTMEKEMKPDLQGLCRVVAAGISAEHAHFPPRPRDES
jgi:uncharacterized membrane protein YhfC